MYSKEKKQEFFGKNYFKGIWATCRRIYGKSSQRNKHYSFCRTQQHTSRFHIHIPAHHSQRATIEIGPGSSIPYYRWKLHWVSRKSINQNGGFNHVQDTYKFSNFHPRRQVCRMGYRQLLPRDAHGTIRVYANPYKDNSARHHLTTKIK